MNAAPATSPSPAPADDKLRADKARSIIARLSNAIQAVDPVGQYSITNCCGAVMIDREGTAKTYHPRFSRYHIDRDKLQEQLASLGMDYSLMDYYVWQDHPGVFLAQMPKDEAIELLFPDKRTRYHANSLKVTKNDADGIQIDDPDIGTYSLIWTKAEGVKE
jgi:hypothetical protein